MHSAESATSLSLLAALKDDVRQHEAWERFVNRYGPRISTWCRQWGLQSADAEDLTQTVLLQLARQMQSFEYDTNGRFRSWLKTVTWRAWARFLEQQRRNPLAAARIDGLEALDTEPARQALMLSLDEEANREVLELALRNVRLRVNENTFEAFRLMAFEGHSGAEVATQLGMKTGAVFVARSRVDRMLLTEVQKIDPEAIPPESQKTDPVD